MKKILTYLIFGLMLFMLVACGPSEGGEATGDITDDDLSGTLNIWWPGGSTSTEAAINKAKSDYEKAHPNVHINITFQSTPDFYYAYNMALMGDAYPDVAYIDHVFVQRLAYDGSIVNLSNMNLGNLKDLYLDTLWEPNLYKNSLYGLPMSVNTLVTVYNKALLTKVLGREFTDADFPKNWNEFIEIGQKINQYNADNGLTGNDRYYLTTIPTGTGNESMGAMYFLALSSRAGGTLMNKDLTQMTINSEQNYFAANKILQLAEGDYTTTTFSESKFEQGKVAFIEMGPWKQTDYSRIAAADENADYGYHSNIPYEEGGNIDSTIGLYSLVISNKSKNPKLAAHFAMYLSTNDEIQLLHAKPQDLMPVTKTGLADEYYNTPEWKVFVEQLNHSCTRCGSAAWPSIQKQVAEFITGLVNGTRNVNYLESLQTGLTEKLEDLEEE